MKYVVEYSSNNSGGTWWLSDDDWHALAGAGWAVDWVAGKKDNKWRDRGGRWLGALATEAYLTVEAATTEAAEHIAIRDWEAVVRQSASEQGCNCCGRPHSFYAQTEEHWLKNKAEEDDDE